MTPLELPAFMAGTVAGMTVWGVVYASLGGASRSLLKSGMDTEQLFSGQSLHYTASSCTALLRCSHAADTCVHASTDCCMLIAMPHCKAMMVCVTYLERHVV